MSAQLPGIGFQAAARLHDRRRMEQARLFAVSLMDGLIEAAR